MQLERVDVVLGLPSYDGKYNPLMHRTMIDMIRATRKAGYSMTDKTWQSSNIGKSRDEICLLAQESKSKWLLFIDSDMVILKEDALLKLMAHDVDIVSGLCHSKQYPYHPCASKLHRVQPVFPPDDNPTPMHKHFTRGYYKPLSEWEDGLVEVDGVGGAFLLIKLDCLEKIPRPWFWMMPLRTPKGWTIEGEDHTFCWNAQQAGLKIYVDTTVQIGHEGSFVYTTENFLEKKEKFAEQVSQKPVEEVVS